jgi:thioredoxin 1
MAPRHKNLQDAAAPAAVASSRVTRQRLGLPLGRGAFGVVLALCAAGAVMVGGCTGPNVIDIHDEGDFQKVVLESDGPVLVDFYKQGCPPCVALEPTIDQLANEYAGRVKVARFQLLTFVFGVPSPEIRDRYKIHLIPTVILFDNGKEVERWFAEFSTAKYRRAMDKLLERRTAPPGSIRISKPPA